jgi:hypothetical protein
VLDREEAGKLRLLLGRERVVRDEPRVPLAPVEQPLLRRVAEQARIERRPAGRVPAGDGPHVVEQPERGARLLVRRGEVVRAPRVRRGAVVPPRARAAGPRLELEDQEVEARGREPPRRGEAAHPGADDDHVGAVHRRAPAMRRRSAVAQQVPRRVGGADDPPGHGRPPGERRVDQPAAGDTAQEGAAIHGLSASRSPTRGCRSPRASGR